MGQYDDLIGPNGQSILQRLYPHMQTVDCPLTADAVDDYLNTGQIIPVPQSLVSRYDIDANWRAIRFRALISLVQGMGPNRHVVVRGTRSEDTLERFRDANPPEYLSQTHYFVVANIASRVYAVDAMSRDVNPDVQGYVSHQALDTLHYTRSFEARENIGF